MTNPDGATRTKAPPSLAMKALQTVEESRRQPSTHEAIQTLVNAPQTAGVIGGGRVFKWLHVPFVGPDRKKIYFDIVDQLHCTRVLLLVTDQYGVQRIVIPEQERQKDINYETGTWGTRSKEMPGGAVERTVSIQGQIKEEQAISNAIREVLEEAGIKAVEIVPMYPEKLDGIVMDPGLGPGRAFYLKIIAGKVRVNRNNEVVVKNKPEAGEGRVIVRAYTLDQALELLDAGEIPVTSMVPILQHNREVTDNKLKAQGTWPGWLQRK